MYMNYPHACIICEAGHAWTFPSFFHCCKGTFSVNVPVSVLSMRAATLTKRIFANVHIIANGLPDKFVIY